MLFIDFLLEFYGVGIIILIINYFRLRMDRVFFWIGIRRNVGY